MKVRWLHSLSFKLFAIMAVSLVTTVLIVSTKHGFTFRALLFDQLSGRILDRAQRTEQVLNGKLSLWKSLLVQLHLDAGNSTIKDLETQSGNVVKLSKDFVSLSLVMDRLGKAPKTITNSFTHIHDHPGLQGKNPKKIKALVAKFVLSFVNTQKSNKKTTLGIVNSSKALGVPTITFALAAKTPDGHRLWAVLVAFVDSLAPYLETGETRNTWVINQEGQILLTGSLKKVLLAKKLDAKLARQALKTDSIMGDLRFQNEEGKVGFYVRSKNFPLAVVFTQMTKYAEAQIFQEIATTALMSIAFLLIALLFSYYGASGLTKNLKSLSETALQIAKGNLNTKVQVKTRDEVGALGMIIDHMSKRLINLIESQKEAVRQEKELELARQIQETLIPTTKNGFIKTVATYQPASECGGDWWGYFKGPENSEIVFVGDAVGHGAPAALMTAMAFSSCTAFTNQMLDSGKVYSPSAILKALNQVFWQAGQGTNTMTFFAAFFMPDKQQLVFANAGHNPPYLIPKNANDPRIKAKGKRPVRYRQLAARGSPLGYMSDVEYRDQVISLQPGDRIVFYTDGLIECSNPEGVQWGKKRFLTTLNNIADRKLNSVCDDLVGEAFKFFQDHPCDDDVTVVVAEYDLAVSDQLEEEAKIA